MAVQRGSPSAQELPSSPATAGNSLSSAGTPTRLSTAPRPEGGTACTLLSRRRAVPGSHASVGHGILTTVRGPPLRTIVAACVLTLVSSFLWAAPAAHAASTFCRIWSAEPPDQPAATRGRAARRRPGPPAAALRRLDPQHRARAARDPRLPARQRRDDGDAASGSTERTAASVTTTAVTPRSSSRTRTGTGTGT